MTAVSRELQINPLTLEVLGGELWPQTDKRKRSHTLAQLAVATFERGRPIEVGDFKDHLNIRHKPSWAPVESMVRCRQVSEDGAFLLRRLMIEQDEMSLLEIHDSTQTRRNGLVVISRTAEWGFNLRTNEDVPNVRSYITATAKDIFAQLN